MRPSIRTGPNPKNYEKLDGELFEKMKKLTGGEEEWIEWSDELHMIIDMKSPKLANIMKHVENHGENVVEKAVREMVDLEERVDLVDDYADMARLSHELYRWLVLMTEGEAKLLVKCGDNHDGVAAWGRMHAKFKRRTITRLMRMQKACMYPKEAKLEEMASAVLAW